MDDLVAAFGLFLVIEGVLYVLFPEFAKRVMAAGLTMPSSRLRSFGLVVVIAGVFVVWLIRG